MLSLLLVITSCSSLFGDGSESDDGSPGAGSEADPTVRIDVHPEGGGPGVTPDQRVRVQASHGRLTVVRVRDRQGDRLQGRWADNKERWISTEQLALAERYVVHAKAVGDNDDRTTVKARFTTVKPKARINTAIAPLDGETVGVGMPVDVRLSDPARKRAAVEKALQVTAKPAVTGSWHWLSDTQLQYRPKNYWTPGTDVQVRVRLTGVDAGGGVWGDETRTVSFSIGDKMVSVVNDATQQMKVYRNDSLIRTIPISDGKNGFRTRSGIKVITEKHPSYDFNSGTIGIDPQSAEGYDLSDVPYAMRITNSGEFLHAAPWNTGLFGRTRGSHGCIGMSKNDAGWLFDQTLRGDIVKVINSPAPEPAIDNGYGAWNLTWAEWRNGSAIP